MKIIILNSIFIEDIFRRLNPYAILKKKKQPLKEQWLRIPDS